MSKMLREVLRWRGPERRATPPEHWANWASSLIERHGRIASRSRMLAMTLALPPAPLFLHSQRWEHHAWNLFPQIKLAIAPLLREAAWKVFPAPLTGTAMKDVLKGDQSRKEAPSAGQSVAAKSYAREHPSLTFAERTQTPSSSRDSLTEREHGFEQTRVGWLPLSRVFQRLESQQTPTTSMQNLLVEESFQLANRVADQRRRIEQAVGQAVGQASVVRQQRKEVAVAEMTDELAKSSLSGAGRAQGLGSPGSKPQGWSSPAVNIQELTEQVMRQIDSQIVARKERMGKPF
jgi:hypothetical protein